MRDFKDDYFKIKRGERPVPVIGGAYHGSIIKFIGPRLIMLESMPGILSKHIYHPNKTPDDILKDELYSIQREYTLRELKYDLGTLLLSGYAMVLNDINLESVMGLAMGVMLGYAIKEGPNVS